VLNKHHMHKGLIKMVQALAGAALGGVSLATQVSYANRQRRELPPEPHPWTGSVGAWAALFVPTVLQARLGTSRLAQTPLDSRHLIKPFCIWYNTSI